MTILPTLYIMGELELRKNSIGVQQFKGTFVLTQSLLSNERLERLISNGFASTYADLALHPAGRSLNFAICEEVNRFCSH